MQTSDPPFDASAPIDALEIALALTRAADSLARKMDSRLGSLHGLSFSDFTLLLHLSRAPLERLKRIDLAEKVGMTASGVTRCLLPLEKIGLITRQADARDARVGYAALSEAGRTLLGYALPTAQSLADEWLARSSSDKNASHANFATTLRRLSA
jgi:DNA-binding MarR family transcriptional regulator